MNPRLIDKFFKELDERIDFPVQVILTGGAVASLYGGSRATLDVDFEVHFPAASERWEKLRRALSEVSAATRISPQYAVNIDRWSSIVLPARKSRLYKRVGKVEVRTLDPGLWAVGKLARFLASDQQDLVAVLKRARLNPVSLAKLWGEALGKSPPSSAQDSFRRHVFHFLDRHTREVFGPKTDTEELKRLFMSAARKAGKA